MNIKDLVPKHKEDQAVIDGLKKLSFDEIEPTIPNFLDGFKISIWPIGDPVAHILEPFAHS